MNERILVVDDEKAIADLVGIYLTKRALMSRLPIAGPMLPRRFWSRSSIWRC